MEILKLAIQKSGRLSEKSLALIRECGIKFNSSKLQLKAQSENFPMEILYLRDDDIPECVADGVADVGIVGQNVADEKQKQVNTIEELGFSKCRLSIAIPRDIPYESINQLSGKKIATTYPNLLQSFLDEKKIDAEIHEISGSVEIAPNIGLADAICDIVSTGSTLLSNGLKEAESIYKSQAIMIGGNTINEEKQSLLDEFLFRIRSVNAARNNKYILMNVPNDSIDKINEILPGIKSPTIMPLAQKGWSSLHSVVNENNFWKIIDKLKKAGSEGILVIPIEKMIL